MTEGESDCGSTQRSNNASAVAKDVGKVALTSAGTAASTSVGGTVGGAAGGALAERLVGDGDGDSKTAGSGAANVDEPAEALKKEFDAMTKGVQGGASSCSSAFPLR